MSQAGTIAGQFAVFVKRGRDATHKSTKVLPHAPEYHPQEVYFFFIFRKYRCLTSCQRARHSHLCGSFRQK